MDSNGEAMATLGTAGANNCPATARFHTNSKAMRALAANNRRLVSAFHDLLPKKY